jgi:glyoxylase-like metal-dependent hydrolase (beta-lactamase superfamily II)
MEVAPGIHRIEGRFAGRHLFQHVLVGERVMLVDTGIVDTPAELIFPYLESVGREPSEIDYVVCTHPDTDHFGGNGQVRSGAPRCRFLAHALDRRWLEDPDAMVAERYDGFRADHGVGDPPEALAESRRLCGEPVTVDIAVTGGEHVTLDADWRVELLHTPGHSEGHLSVWDPRSKTLIIADAAMGAALPYVDGSPALAATYTHPGPYAETSARLREKGAELLLTAHFPAMRGAEIADHLDLSSRLVADVEAAVLATISSADGGVGLREIIDAVDARLGPLPAEMRDTWASPVVGHLDELTAAGRIAGAPAEGRTTYTTGAGASNAA